MKALTSHRRPTRFSRCLSIILGISTGAALAQGPIASSPRAAQDLGLKVSAEASLPVACSIADTSNCQSPDETSMVLMDRYNGPDLYVADDFVALSTDLDQLCWSVAFAGLPPGSDFTACSDPDGTYGPPMDQFHVRLYENDNGLPGNLLYVWAPVLITSKEWRGGESRIWDYSATFDPPLGGLTIGQRYWIEISGAGNDNCTVYTFLSEEGNGFYLHEKNHFPPWENQAWSLEDRSGDNMDVAFCLGGSAAPATEVPPVITGACCQCDGTCTSDVPWADCLGQTCRTSSCASQCAPGDQTPPCEVQPLYDRATFFPEQSCAEIVCEDAGTLGVPGDDCGDPIVIATSYQGEMIDLPFNTDCSTTDGRVILPCNCDTSYEHCGAASPTFQNDIWYEFMAPGTGSAYIDLCGDTDFDATIAAYSNGTSTCPNVDDVTGLRTLCPPPLEDLVLSRFHGDLCSADHGEASVRVCGIRNGACVLIRVGGDADSGAGLLTLFSESSSVFPSSLPVPERIENDGGALVVSVKNRMLSFSAGDPGHQQAIRVTFASLPGAFSQLDGTTMWVGEPEEFDELPSMGYDRPCRNPCPPGDTTCSPCTGATFYSAELQCEPYFRDWTVVGSGNPDWDGMIHVRDPNIVPSRLVLGGGAIAEPAIYDIAVIDSTGCPSAEDHYSWPPVEITTAGWGDVATLFEGTYVAPDNSVAIDDVLAMIQKYAGLPGNGGLPIKARIDLLGTTAGPSATLDGIIDISDVVIVLDAFSGAGFPFEQPSDPSPCGCPDD